WCIYHIGIHVTHWDHKDQGRSITIATIVSPLTSRSHFRHSDVKKPHAQRSQIAKNLLKYSRSAERHYGGKDEKGSLCGFASSVAQEKLSPDAMNTVTNLILRRSFCWHFR
ncbi:unnamed protein product, partial [Caenorhabditis auriculariae]